MIEAQNPLPESFHKGLRAFNQRAFYEAHEHFEDAWRDTPGDEREFFRAFLHLSGGFYRLTQDRPEAARKFFNHAQKWLALFPDQYQGYNIGEIKDYIQQLINAINHSIHANAILAEKYQPIHPMEDADQ